jgi:hypothetical protein
MYHGEESNESQIATNQRLVVLRRICHLFMDNKHLAKEWETENRGRKRKRKEDGDDLERLSQIDLPHHTLGFEIPVDL